MKKSFLFLKKLLFSDIQAVILQSMFYALIGIYAPTSSCMEANIQQLAQRQKELNSVYFSTESYVILDRSSWYHIKDQRPTGQVVSILKPEHHSPYNGYFIVTTKEIHRDPNNRLIEKNFYEPSKPVAFVLGSVLIGTALYFFYKDKLASE